MFKPLLAASLDDIGQLHGWGDIFGSPKLDGIRALIINGQVVSRNLKPIPNLHVQHVLKGLPEGLDGELVVGSPTAGSVFNRTSSGVMSVYGEPDFKFHIFDHVQQPASFYYRQEYLKAIALPPLFTEVVTQTLLDTPKDVERYEQEQLDNGYEGIMLRRGSGLYKHGRSTHKEGFLWKLKRFRDGEALITDVLEGETNTNALDRLATGAATRSTHKANMLPNAQIGTIVGTDLKTGQIITMSAGRMPHADRKRYWVFQHELLGKVAKYKCFDYGAVDAPRFATFQGLRDTSDL